MIRAIVYKSKGRIVLPFTQSRTAAACAATGLTSSVSVGKCEMICRRISLGSLDRFVYTFVRRICPCSSRPSNEKAGF